MNPPNTPPSIRVVTLTASELHELIAEATADGYRRAIEDVRPFFDALRAMKREAEGKMTAGEVGELLGCSARQVHAYHVPNGLKRYSPGRKAFFLRSDVFAYVRAHPLESKTSGGADP